MTDRDVVSSIDLRCNNKLDTWKKLTNSKKGQISLSTRRRPQVQYLPMGRMEK